MIPVKSRIAESAHVPSLEAYEEMYRRSLEDPEGFWGEAAGTLDWFHEPVAAGAWDYHEVEVSWFPGGRLNASYNCVDRHVLSQPEKTAIIWAKDEAGEYEHISYPPAPAGGLSGRQRPQGPRGSEGGSGVHLPADDSGAGLHDAGLRPHRRHPLHRLRGFLRGLPKGPDPGRRLQDSGDRQRGSAGRQEDSL